MMEAAANIDVQSVRGPQTQRQHQAEFHDRFARSRSLLHFTARRILGCSAEAELAIRNCWRRASRNPPGFRYDGAFRSWLLRILINEALAVRRFGQWQQLSQERSHPGTWKELGAR